MFFGWLIGLILLAYCIRLALLINLTQPNCCENNIQGHVLINKPVCLTFFLMLMVENSLCFIIYFFIYVILILNLVLSPIKSTQPNPTQLFKGWLTFL